VAAKQSDEVYPKVPTIYADSDSLLYTSSTADAVPLPQMGKAFLFVLTR